MTGARPMSRNDDWHTRGDSQMVVTSSTSGIQSGEKRQSCPRDRRVCKVNRSCSREEGKEMNDGVSSRQHGRAKGMAKLESTRNSAQQRGCGAGLCKKRKVREREIANERERQQRRAVGSIAASKGRMLREPIKPTLRRYNLQQGPPVKGRLANALPLSDHPDEKGVRVKEASPPP